MLLLYDQEGAHTLPAPLLKWKNSTLLWKEFGYSNILLNKDSLHVPWEKAWMIKTCLKFIEEVEKVPSMCNLSLSNNKVSGTSDNHTNTLLAYRTFSDWLILYFGSSLSCSNNCSLLW